MENLENFDLSGIRKVTLKDLKAIALGYAYIRTVLATEAEYFAPRLYASKSFYQSLPHVYDFLRIPVNVSMPVRVKLPASAQPAVPEERILEEREGQYEIRDQLIIGPRKESFEVLTPKTLVTLQREEVLRATPEWLAETGVEEGCDVVVRTYVDRRSIIRILGS